MNKTINQISNNERVQNAFCSAYGYKEEIESVVDGLVVMIPNPESKQDFVGDKILGFIKEVVASQEVIKAREEAEVLHNQSAQTLTI